MAIGQRNSYGTDAPISPNYLGDALTQVDNMEFRNRQEKRLIADKKEAERKANLVKDDFDPTVELTGNQSINDLSIPFSIQSAKRYSDNVNKINATTNLAERSRYMQENQRIKQNFDNYAQVPKILNTKMSEILAGVKEGKLNERDAERAGHMLDSLNSGKARVTLDENSIPRLTTFKVTPTGELELDAQGKPIVLAENQDLASMIKSFEVHPNSTYDTDLASATDKFKLDKNSWETNGNKITREVKDQRTEDVANAFAQAKVSLPHERFELSQRTGIPETDIDALKQVVAKQFKDKINETKLQDHDYAFDTNARENRKEAKEEVQSATAQFGEYREDNFLGDKDKGKHISGDTVLQNMVTFPENKLTFKNLGGERSKLNSGFVEGITKDKNSNRFVITGKALKDKNVKFKMPDGKLLDLLSAQQKLQDGSTPQQVRESLQAQLDSYSQGDNYGSFTRIVPESEVSGLMLKTKFKTVSALNKKLKELNQDEEKAKPKIDY